METFKIYLTSWQKRMVNDYTGKDVSIIAVPVDGGFKALYMALIPPNSTKYAYMYLTDEQMAMVKELFGDIEPCHYLDLGTNLPLTFI